MFNDYATWAKLVQWIFDLRSDPAFEYAVGRLEMSRGMQLLVSFCKRNDSTVSHDNLYLYALACIWIAIKTDGVQYNGMSASTLRACAHDTFSVKDIVSAELEVLIDVDYHVMSSCSREECIAGLLHQYPRCIRGPVCELCKLLIDLSYVAIPDADACDIANSALLLALVLTENLEWAVFTKDGDRHARTMLVTLNKFLKHEYLTVPFAKEVTKVPLVAVMVV